MGAYVDAQVESHSFPSSETPMATLILPDRIHRRTYLDKDAIDATYDE